MIGCRAAAIVRRGVW